MIMTERSFSWKTPSHVTFQVMDNNGKLIEKNHDDFYFPGITMSTTFDIAQETYDKSMNYAYTVYSSWGSNRIGEFGFTPGGMVCRVFNEDIRFSILTFYTGQLLRPPERIDDNDIV
jgi:hypothetical protein